MSLLKRIMRYGVYGGLRLGFDLLHTKIFFPTARLVRRPVYVRGKPSIEWGPGFTCGVGLRLDAFPDVDKVVLKIGAHVQVNDYVHIAAIEHVSIGDHTLIASKVFISDHNHGDYSCADPTSSPEVPPNARPLVARPVIIGQRVWIGEHVCILPGVTIGNGAIIGAGSVVTKDIPPNTIAVGAPARSVRHYDAGCQAWVSVSKEASPFK